MDGSSSTETAAQADARSGRSQRLDWAGRGGDPRPTAVWPNDRPSLGPSPQICSPPIPQLGPTKYPGNSIGHSLFLRTEDPPSHPRARTGYASGRWCVRPPSGGRSPARDLLRPRAQRSEQARRVEMRRRVPGSRIGPWGLCRPAGRFAPLLRFGQLFALE